MRFSQYPLTTFWGIFEAAFRLRLNPRMLLADAPPRARVAGHNRSPLPALTGLRFFAAFYVVLGHAVPWLEPRFRVPAFVNTFLANGYLAVSLFFLLSGFILSYTYAEISSSVF